MIYAMVDAPSLGFKVEPSEARDLVAIGERIKTAAAEQLPAVHPENAGDPYDQPDAVRGAAATRRQARRRATPSSCRRAASTARPAALEPAPGWRSCTPRARSRPARSFVHESIIGTKFTGEIVATPEVCGRPGVRCAITGRAWVTAFHQYVLDPSDPFPTGYRLGDTWPGG